MFRKASLLFEGHLKDFPVDPLEKLLKNFLVESTGKNPGGIFHIISGKIVLEASGEICVRFCGTISEFSLAKTLAEFLDRLLVESLEQCLEEYQEESRVETLE